MRVGTTVTATRDINDLVSRVFVPHGTQGKIAYVYYGDIGPTKYLVAFPNGRVVVPATNSPINASERPRIASLIKKDAMTITAQDMEVLTHRPTKFTTQDAKDAAQAMLYLYDAETLGSLDRDELEELVRNEIGEEYTQSLELGDLDIMRFIPTVADFIYFEVNSKKRNLQKDVEEKKRYEENLRLRDLENKKEEVDILLDYDPEDEESKFVEDESHGLDIPQGYVELWVIMESDTGYDSLAQGLSKLRSALPTSFDLPEPEDYFNAEDLAIPSEEAPLQEGYIGTLLEFVGTLNDVRDLYLRLRDFDDSNPSIFIDLQGSDLLLPGGITLHNRNFEIVEFLDILPGDKVAAILRLCAQLRIRI